MSWSSGVARQHVSYFSKLAARRVDAIGNVGNGIIVFRGHFGGPDVGLWFQLST